jgi:hypothetical protein
MNLYIVTTGLPGPDPATCGFVEVEDEAGASVGPAQTGADWHEHPTSAGLYRLGPFASDPFLSPTHAATIVRALAATDPVAYEGDRTEGDYVCAVCQQYAEDAGSVEHAPDCPWRLAVEWVAREAEPAEPQDLVTVPVQVIVDILASADGGCPSCTDDLAVMMRDVDPERDWPSMVRSALR